MTRGVAFFAYNTSQIDYVKLAILAARYSKRHMPSLPTCLITDSGSWDWCQRSYKKEVELAFDEITLAEPAQQNNKRVHHDSPYHKFVSDFKNGNKHRVFEYTPFDQTLLLDIDYIIQNKDFEYVFETDNAVTLFHKAEYLTRNSPAQAQRYLNDQGIPMLWSTVVYFDRRNPTAKMFFDLWAHIGENYDFYKFIYGLPGKLYRTDFCVSIATHIMNGMGPGSVIDEFPGRMINMSQHDDIVKINDVDDWIYMVNNREEQWKDTLTRIAGENVHVMNKRSLDRHWDDLMEKL